MSRIQLCDTESRSGIRDSLAFGFDAPINWPPSIPVGSERPGRILGKPLSTALRRLDVPSFRLPPKHRCIALLEN